MKYNALKYLFFLVACLLWGIKSRAQDGRIAIRGMVTDTMGHSLKSATVSLYSGKVLHKQVTNTDKGFEFNSLSPGKYLLAASFAGYHTDTVRLTLTAKDSLVSAGRIRLKSEAIKLKEVEIKSEGPPVVLKGDTVVYNASAFKTPPNSTVEELIKALPGLVVDHDGNITYQGRPIQYISINGKQYFINDPKLISKSLFADMVSKIELFDAPSKESKRTGIKDPDPQKALNLVIKKGVSLAINGKVYGGVTDQGGYTAGATANSFAGDRMVIANINHNNLSDLYTGQEKLSESPLSVHGQSTNTNAGATFSDKLSRAVSLNMNYGGRLSNLKNLTSSNQQTFYSDSTQLRMVNGSNVTTGFNHSLDGEMQFVLDTLETGFINYKPNINFGQNKNRSKNSTDQYLQSNGSQYLTSTGTTDNTSNDQSSNIAGELALIKAWKNRSLNFSFSHNNNSANTDGVLKSETRFFDASGTLLQDRQVNQQFKQSSSNSDYNFNLTGNEIISPTQTFSVSYMAFLHHDEAKRASYDFDASTNSYDLLDTLTTNNLKNINTTQNVNLGYRYFKGNFNSTVGAGLQHILLESDDFIKDDFLRKGFINWTGNASMGYKLGPKTDVTKLKPSEVVNALLNQVNKQINLDYNVSSRSPSLTEWRSLPDVSDPLYIRTGNPDLKPEQDHSLTLRYSATQFKKGKSFQLNLTGRYRIGAIVSTIDLLPGGVQRSGYVNAGSLYDGSANATFEFPLGEIKNGNIRITNSAGYLQDLSLVNGERNIREGLNVGQQFGVHYRRAARLELSLTGSWKYDNSRYSLQPDRNTASFIQNYRVGADCALPWAIRVSSNYGISFFGAQSGLPSTHTVLWNAAIIKNVFKSNRGELRFTAFDLLNSSNGISQRADGNSVTRNENNTPGRQLLLTFAYFIRSNQQ